MDSLLDVGFSPHNSNFFGQGWQRQWFLYFCRDIYHCLSQYLLRLENALDQNSERKILFGGTGMNQSHTIMHTTYFQHYTVHYPRVSLDEFKVILTKMIVDGLNQAEVYVF